MESMLIRPSDEKNCSAIHIPSSKSYVHRALIASVLANSQSIIRNVSFSDDVNATISCINTLGAHISIKDDFIMVIPPKEKAENPVFNCAESGSTLRFIIPVALVLCESAEFTGSEKLMERPIDDYIHLFEENGIFYEYKKGSFLKVSGKIKNNYFKISANVSSQFLTGLLLALPMLDYDSVIEIDGKVMSKPYIDITLDVLKNYGIKIINDDYRKFKIKGKQKYACSEYFISGDWSQAAFFAVFGAICKDTKICGISKNTIQGDYAVIDILRKMGADITENENSVTVKKSHLHSINKINAKDFPDLVPILSLACALADGTTVIDGTDRLKYKESDRVHSVINLINSIGGNIKSEENRLVICGKNTLSGGKADSFNDHRIAMTAAVAASVCKNGILIENPMCINKSYPDFYRDLLLTGGVKYERNMGK